MVISAPWIIAGAVFILVLFIVLVICMRKKARTHLNVSLEDDNDELRSAEDLGPLSQTLAQEQNEPDEPEKNIFIQDRRKAQDRRGNSAASQNTDLLTEYEVYLQFGYLERAAKTLSYYLDSLDDPPARLQKKLLKLYLLTKQVDEYSYLLEHMYQNKLIGKDNFQQAVIIGLKSDKNNLNLRLMAHTELDWGPEEILFQIGLGNKAKQQLHSTLTGNSHTLREIDSSITDSNLEEPNISQQRKSKIQQNASLDARKNLVTGSLKMNTVPLAPEEKITLKGFASPKNRAKIFMLSEDYDNAVQSFEEALKSEERPLTLLTDLLQIDFLTKNTEQFIKHFHTYLQSLGDQGEALKKQMLEKGRALGPHPFFSEIESASTPKEWTQIAEKYISNDKTETKQLINERKQLVITEKNSEQGENLVLTRQEPDEFTYSSSILTDAQARLEYGQIEEAISTLEAALLDKPESEMLYLPLLKLYQRLDDYERFNQFFQKMQKNSSLIPEKAVLALTRLAKTFENKKLEKK